MPATTTTGAPTSLGGRLRHYRQLAGLSRETVAARSGRGYRSLCCWENDSRAPSLAHLRELAVIYEVAVVDLLGEADHMPHAGAA